MTREGVSEIDQIQPLTFITIEDNIAHRGDKYDDISSRRFLVHYTYSPLCTPKIDTRKRRTKMGDRGKE
jgi:hypothetical protein